MRNKYSLTIISMLFYVCSMAQSITPFVISSTGNFSSSANFSLSSTAGEFMVKTETGANNIITQGFQQPGNAVTYVQEIDKGKISITVYPNPAVDYLTVEISSDKNAGFNIEILDLIGKKMTVKYTEYKSSYTSVYIINTAALADGIYMLRITSSNNDFQKVIKISKLK